MSLGGGWTFLHTFEKFLKKAGHEIVDNVDACEVYFLSGSTMITPEQFEEAKGKGKKIVVRVDNIPRNSRNRNTGTSRLKRFTSQADLVIYQSNWAKMFVGGWLGIEGPVILNGADDDIFKSEGDTRPVDGTPQCLYVQYNRDETKQWHVAWYEFQMIRRKYPTAHLWIVGNFSPELIAHNFDFFEFGQEAYEYLGVIEDPKQMAEIMRGATNLLLPYFNDACSNTLIEYLQCQKKEDTLTVLFNDTGGNMQIRQAYEENPDRLSASHMTNEYVQAISKLF